MATCRVAARDDPLGLDVRYRGEVIDRGGDVLERAGPAAAVLPDPPELDVPGGDPSPGQVDREWRHQRPVPARPPEPTVEQHDARPRPSVPSGQVEIGDLVVVVAVRDARRGRRRGRRK